MTEEESRDIKERGIILPEGIQVRLPGQPDRPEPIVPQIYPSAYLRGGDGIGDCNCWIEPDASYTQAVWTIGPRVLDDQSTSGIALPFSFNLYGDTYSTVYININGNVSFENANATFTASGFPAGSVKMLAPFWADVDLGSTMQPGVYNRVMYKVTPTAMYVNWVNVGYYPTQTDKVNTFQLIFTDGTDPVIGVGKNVSFCYKDMQWTTGGASGGSNGLGGTPATVGANRGNNADYIQFGRFNRPDAEYDGPFGDPDGVQWLNFKNFVFSTVTSSQNIAPVATGQYLCDTLQACVGQMAELELTFLAPEREQTMTVTASASTIPSWAANVVGDSLVVSVTGQFTPTEDDLGFHEVVFTGTDNGTPNLTNTISIVIEVIPPPSEPPTISGNPIFCAGQSTTLSASGPFSSFLWSNGQTGSSITVSTPGEYIVTGGIGLCQMTSPPVTVTQVQSPALVISGLNAYCGLPLPELTASPGFENYQWSNDSTGTTTIAGAGTYTVSGEFEGCINTSAPFTVAEVDPGPPVITGALQYCEGQSTTLTFNTSAYTSREWSTGYTGPYLTATEGTYTVTASYHNCTYTSEPVTVEEVTPPPIIVTGDTAYCSNSTAALAATPGFDSYTWNNSSTGQTVNVTAGSYFVTGRIGPCPAFSNTFTVTAIPAPAPVIAGLDVSCGGAPTTLRTTEAYPAYLWSEASTTDAITVGNGVYTVTVTLANGCSGTSAPVTVVLGSDPRAAFSTDPASPQEIGTTVAFTDLSQGNGSTIVAWAWTFGTMDVNSIVSSPIHTFEQPGRHPITLTITNADGCTNSITSIYHIRPEEVVIPNVFTPNGDGHNDAFVIENGELYSNLLTVFNRWGQKVFEASDYRNTWRATDIPDGTYYYVFVIHDDDREYTGHVTIVR